MEKEIAECIKKEFDKKHGSTWHCIVGRNFGTSLPFPPAFDGFYVFLAEFVFFFWMFRWLDFWVLSVWLVYCCDACYLFVEILLSFGGVFLILSLRDWWVLFVVFGWMDVWIFELLVSFTILGLHCASNCLENWIVRAFWVNYGLFCCESFAYGTWLLYSAFLQWLAVNFMVF